METTKNNTTTNGFENYPLLSARVPKEVPMGYIPARGFDYFSAAQLYGYAESGWLLDQLNAIEIHRDLREAGAVQWTGETELTDEHDYVIQHENHVGLVKIVIFAHAKESVKKAAETILENLEVYPALNGDVWSLVEFEAFHWSYEQGHIENERLDELYELREKRELTHDERLELGEIEMEETQFMSESTYPSEVFEDSGQFEQVDIDAVIV